ncbi:MAG: hypothetical protein H6597_06800 [Flavobacteriales bacterium]|nr:hypothetical protein [Flavobacteriales bacterium]
MKPWRIDLPDWRKANQDVLGYMLTRAEERLEHTSEQDKNIRERAFTLINILLPLVALLIGYFAGKPPEFMEDFSAHWKVILALVFTPVLFALGVLVWMVFPRALFSKGRKPSETFNQQFLVGPLSKEEQYCSLLISSLEKLEAEIGHNDKVNACRITWLRVVLALLGLWLAGMLTTLLLR